MEIKIQKTSAPKQKPDSNGLGFGKHFTDHMFIMDYTRERGWYDARIVPFGNLELHPASTVFHYGAEIFEGLKAYRTAEGKVQLFRPEENIRRLNSSADRMRLPLVDEKELLAALVKLIEIEQDWVPSAPGTSLYIRPFLFGADPFLGVHSINRSMFVIILSPVGSYYKEGINPVKIAIEEEDVRAVRGGTGYAKCGGNYAASNRAGERAEQKGYSQVLWLDGVEHKYIDEVGAMNVFFVIDGKVITPSLAEGSILPGVTRNSCIKLLSDMGYEVEERKLSEEEVIEAYKNGKLDEAFGTGTAAVVSPMGILDTGDFKMVINNNEIGEVAQKVYDALTGIQWGKCEDELGWIVKVC